MDIDTIYTEIGFKIKKARKEKKITQEELGKKLELARTSITNIENGKQQILIHYLYKIANFLDIDILTLLPNQNKTKKFLEELPDLINDEIKTLKNIEMKINIKSKQLEKLNELIKEAKTIS